MRTIVYIDGYNLYYSRLRHTDYKWLDVVDLFERWICHQQDPSAEVVEIRYFTSFVKAKFARHGQDSVIAQNSYMRALAQLHPGLIKIEISNHDASKDRPLKYLNPPDLTERVDTWKLVEKKTDVHIGVQMYRDVALGNCDQIVLCTNDSDLEPALRYIRQDFPTIEVGLVIPGRNELRKNRVRPISQSLADHATWVRKQIPDSELRNSQMPDKVPTQKKPISKPAYW